ncbi:hypothetical protein HY212_03430 [Candidatus Pacearchaeota archaeon]|nr:hypothetical protein [Candidatus Pacearchaeota archaeon]
MKIQKIAFIVLVLALILSVTYALTVSVNAASLSGTGSKDISFCSCDGTRGWDSGSQCPPLTSAQASYCAAYS